MAITILCFGKIAEVAGSRLVVDDIADTDLLKQQLELQFPLLKDMAYVIAVDKSMINGTTILTSNSTVALLPPFSGG